MTKRSTKPVRTLDLSTLQSVAGGSGKKKDKELEYLKVELVDILITGV